MANKWKFVPKYLLDIIVVFFSRYCVSYFASAKCVRRYMSGDFNVI